MPDSQQILPILPLGVEDLLTGAVESARLEMKASWDEDFIGIPAIRTICAFANDLQNLNGGYVVIGVREEKGRVIRPVDGLRPEELEAAQRWLRGQCNRIEPTYMPVFAPVRIDGRLVLVVWAPASDVRPHQAPLKGGAERAYFVRVGSDTVQAQKELLTRLMQQTARVPFDDRRAQDARIEDLREAKVREFLRDVHSDLLDDPDMHRVYRAMNMTRPVNGHDAPRNVALLFFTEDPERWFRGARIEVVQFGDDAGGNTLDERIFRGGIHEQVRQSIAYLETLVSTHIEKDSEGLASRSWVAFPLPALREVLVNAVYHRSYQDSVEPIKVYFYPDRVEITSYPGPVDGIELVHLRPRGSPPPVPARNRRIGELLKELRLSEARGTGIPKIFRTMVENGSPDPRFEFDAARSYFRVIFPAHPEYVALAVLRRAAHLTAIGEADAAIQLLQETWREAPGSQSLAEALMREHAHRGNLDAKEKIAEELERERSQSTRKPAQSGQEGLDRARSLLESAIREPSSATRQALLQDVERISNWIARTGPESSIRASAWFLLGQTRQALGKPDTSIEEAFQLAVDLAPADAEYAEALAAMRRIRMEKKSE